MQVLKYTLGLGRNIIEMPNGSKILNAQMQHGKLTMWAMGDLGAPKHERNVFVVGTGHEFSHLSKENYIATVQDGVFVWHVFDYGE